MFVFPMAGLSRRFTEAGYTVPKYMLQAKGKSLFEHAVGGFSAYFESIPFLFVARDVQGTAHFLRDETKRLGLRDARIVILNHETAGQAETVACGLHQAGEVAQTPVTIFNIDTFRPNFQFPTDFDLEKIDGYLEVFRGEGANWSYVRPAAPDSNRVAETTEKVPISNLCCTGLYHFGSARLYLNAYAHFQGGEAASMGLKELYVAPMYNLLLRQGRDIRHHRIARSDVVFCGVPDEYLDFQNS